MNSDELKRFDEASNHPYECRCALCVEWWAQVGPEDDDDDSPYCECGNDPIEDEEASNQCFSCGKPFA